MTQLTIEMDGQELRGDTWVTPLDFIDQDIEDGRLVSLKGATPEMLPGLESCEGRQAGGGRAEWGK